MACLCGGALGSAAAFLDSAVWVCMLSVVRRSLRMMSAGYVALVLLALAVWPAQAATVSGFVKDSLSGEPLAFVSVYLSDGSVGTVSDRSGYYVLSAR